MRALVVLLLDGGGDGDLGLLATGGLAAAVSIAYNGGRGNGSALGELMGLFDGAIHSWRGG